MEESISERVWKGLYWGPSGVIAQAEKESQEKGTRGKKLKDLSALSSIYYSAAGHAKAKIKTAPLSEKLLWTVRATWCLLKAYKLSEKLVYEHSGIEYMTPEQLDVRASILIAVKSYRKAMAAIDEALERENVTIDTRMLLNISLAKLCDIEKFPSLAEDALKRASELEKEARPTTLVRLYKAYAEHCKKLGYHDMAYVLAQKAFVFASEHNLDDQKIKIQPLLK